MHVRIYIYVYVTVKDRTTINTEIFQQSLKDLPTLNVTEQFCDHCSFRTFTPIHLV